jgi:hypothetical protein
MPSPIQELSHTEEFHEAQTVRALAQLLRGRSYEEIRQRMYDKPPGTAWWSACKTELDIRNSEQMAAALEATSRVLERMKNSTQHFEQLSETLVHSASETAEFLKGTRDTARRLELAIYVAIGMTLVQFFNLVFEIFHKP